MKEVWLVTYTPSYSESCICLACASEEIAKKYINKKDAAERKRFDYFNIDVCNSIEELDKFL